MPIMGSAMEKDYILERVDFSGFEKKDLYVSLSKDKKEEEIFSQAVDKTENPEYLHWKEIKHKSWIPKSLSPKEFWYLVKSIRTSLFSRDSMRTGIKDKDGNKFTWQKLQRYEKFLHELDMETGGSILLSDSFLSDTDKQRFVSRGIIEEAIATSQLEGAHTTRAAAKKMLLEGRKPTNNSERMILNSHKIMQAIEGTYKNKELSLEIIFELHRIISEETDIPSNRQGVFRTDDDDIVIAPNEPNIITYRVPKIEFVEKEILHLIKFANDKIETTFIHPVIKGIMLHFWMALLHPFYDGNGRMARALFYWYVLRKGYWAFSFLPISTKIRNSPGQYSKAFIYSEQDDNDLTYFIDYNIRKIKEAGEDFKKYFNKSVRESKIENKVIKSGFNLNERQIKLLRHLFLKPDERTNPTAHMKIYGIGKLTAIKDLKQLSEKGFLSRKKQGKNIFYYPTEEVIKLFNKVEKE